MTRATLDASGPFMRHPLQPHSSRDRMTRTEDTIVLCHLGVPRLDPDDRSLFHRWAPAPPYAPHVWRAPATAARRNHTATRSVTAATLTETTMAIGQTQAELRAAHLRYHLLMADVLTPDQMRRYGELRGYSGIDQGQRHHPKLHR
jgi:hypothetical protein